jgi:hypothetical protein
MISPYIDKIAQDSIRMAKDFADFDKAIDHYRNIGYYLWGTEIFLLLAGVAFYFFLSRIKRFFN